MMRSLTWSIHVFIAAMVLCAASTTLAGGVLYVDADVVGGNNGSSWSDAYTELQSALAVAVAGDEIRVAEGTYLPDYNVSTATHTGERDAASHEVAASDPRYQVNGEPVEVYSTTHLGLVVVPTNSISSAVLTPVLFVKSINSAVP